MKWLFQLKNTSSRRDKLLQTVDVMVYFTLFSFFFKAIITQLIASRKFLMWCSNLLSFFFFLFFVDGDDTEDSQSSSSSAQREAEQRNS